MALALHQLLATEKDLKSQANAALTTLYQRMEKAALLSGISRVYRPAADDGETLPGEKTLVQLRVEGEIPPVVGKLAALYDTILRKEIANTQAAADVVVDGQVLLPKVPVCALLFLEKQATDLKAFVSKLPVLDPSETWHHDEAQGCWATDPSETHRTKKVPRAFVKAAATDKHPAQVEIVHEDVIAGYWRTIKFSGAVSADRKATLLSRVEKLQAAIKVAREEANAVKVGNAAMGAKVFDYLFAK